MTAKKYLKSAIVLDRRIETLENRIEETWTALTRITADPAKEFVDGSKSQGANDGLIDKAGELKEQLIEAKARAIVLRATMTIEIQSLDNADFIKVLELRYLERDEKGKPLKWEKIADMMDYSESNVYWLHGKALKEFGEKFSSKLESEI